jgi:polysaccharide export outer membrane protein
MNSTQSTLRQVLNGTSLALLAGIVLLAAGCGLFSSGKTHALGADAFGGGQETRLRVGDQLQIRLDFGGQNPQLSQQNIDSSIDDNGEVTLPLIGRIKADGLTTTELSERIEANYVPRYYIRCSVNVLVTVRYFYVGGEVRNPGRFPWTDDTTLLKAINTAGGFTDYANRGRVELTRGKAKKVFNAEELRRNPEMDVPIQPGDSIFIARSIF